MEMKLTKPQVVALVSAMRKDGAMYARVNRAGGAYRRCCESLAARGLLTDDPPFRITDAGLEALRAYRADRWVKRGCDAYLADLKEVEAAIRDRQNRAAA